MPKTHTTPRGVVIPIDVVIAAFREAFAAAKESSSDNRDADSPGGATVTPGEIAEDVGAFFVALGAAALPGILEANARRLR